jgi:transposase
LSTNVQLRAEGAGKLLTLLLRPGHRPEAIVVPQLMAGGAVTRRGAGRPQHRPHRLVGDKAYRRRQLRQYVRRRGSRVTMPRKSNAHRPGPFDRISYRQRHTIERLMNRYKQCRRIATRDDKRAANDQAMWYIATLVLWLGFANTP